MSQQIDGYISDHYIIIYISLKTLLLPCKKKLIQSCRVIEEQLLVFQAVIFLCSCYNLVLYICKQLLRKLQQTNISSPPWDRFLNLLASCATFAKCPLIDISK